MASAGTATYLAESIPAIVGPDIRCEMLGIQYRLGRLRAEAQILDYLASWLPQHQPWDDAICNEFDALVQGLRMSSFHTTAPASLVHTP